MVPTVASLAIVLVFSLAKDILLNVSAPGLNFLPIAPVPLVHLPGNLVADLHECVHLTKIRNMTTSARTKSIIKLVKICAKGGKGVRLLK